MKLSEITLGTTYYIQDENTVFSAKLLDFSSKEMTQEVYKSEDWEYHGFDSIDELIQQNEKEKKDYIACPILVSLEFDIENENGYNQKVYLSCDGVNINSIFSTKELLLQHLSDNIL